MGWFQKKFLTLPFLGNSSVCRRERPSRATCKLHWVLMCSALLMPLILFLLPKLHLSRQKATSWEMWWGCLQYVWQVARSTWQAFFTKMFLRKLLPPTLIWTGTLLMLFRTFCLVIQHAFVIVSSLNWVVSHAVNPRRTFINLQCCSSVGTCVYVSNLLMYIRNLVCQFNTQMPKNAFIWRKLFTCLAKLW